MNTRHSRRAVYRSRPTIAADDISSGPNRSESSMLSCATSWTHEVATGIRVIVAAGRTQPMVPVRTGTVPAAALSLLLGGRHNRPHRESSAARSQAAAHQPAGSDSRGSAARRWAGPSQGERRMNHDALRGNPVDGEAPVPRSRGSRRDVRADHKGRKRQGHGRCGAFRRSTYRPLSASRDAGIGTVGAGMGCGGDEGGVREVATAALHQHWEGFRTMPIGERLRARQVPYRLGSHRNVRIERRTLPSVT